MSLQAVRRVILRAITQPEFREALRSNPDTSLDDDLTPEEVAFLRAMDWDSVSSGGHELEQRVSRMGSIVPAAVEQKPSDGNPSGGA